MKIPHAPCHDESSGHSSEAKSASQTVIHDDPAKSTISTLCVSAKRSDSRFYVASDDISLMLVKQWSSQNRHIIKAIDNLLLISQCLS